MTTRIEYRWSCPYCEVSRTSHGRVPEEDIRHRAISAVTGHVSATEGEGHGPRHSLPPDFDAACHIERGDE